VTATDAFTYQALPMRVLFGLGRLTELPGEASTLDLQRLLVLITPGQRGVPATQPATHNSPALVEHVRAFGRENDG
jgi:hypothetical protein